MSRLVLMRHAKAVPAGSVDDFDRPLAQTGLDDCVAAAAWLKTISGANLHYSPRALKVKCSTDHTISLAVLIRHSYLALVIFEDSQTSFPQYSRPSFLSRASFLSLPCQSNPELAKI